jgi:GT2 family glycosyltransferase
MASSSNVDIIVVNWNAGRQLFDCISSIQTCGTPFVANTIVVDNGSTDGSANSVQNMLGVKVIFTGQNLGFGKACNLGAQHTKSEYLLFLNPDAALYSNTLPKALTFMQDPINAEVGICGVQLIDDLGHVSRSCSRLPTAMGFVCQAVGLDRLFPKLGHFMTEWGHDETIEVDQVIGAFFLVRRTVFEALQGFDEQFFVYFEEVDFSRRAREAGWRSVYLANAQAFHAGGGTSNQVKAKRLFYITRSRVLYAFKHFSFVGASLVLLTTLLIEPVSRAALALLRGSWSSFKEAWVGYAMLWKWLPQWVFKGSTR